MKQIKGAAISAILLLSLVLASCANSGPAVSDQSSAAQTEARELTGSSENTEASETAAAAATAAEYAETSAAAEIAATASTAAEYADTSAAAEIAATASTAAEYAETSAAAETAATASTAAEYAETSVAAEIAATASTAAEYADTSAAAETAATASIAAETAAAAATAAEYAETAATAATAATADEWSGTFGTDDTAFEQESRYADSIRKKSSIEAGILGVNKYGSIVLTIGPQTLRELGYEEGDIILVEIGDLEIEMPVVTAYSDVNSGSPLCLLKSDPDGGQEYVILAVNMYDFVRAYNIADIRTIEEEPGFECIWEKGYDVNTPIYLSIIEKQGYAEEYEDHKLSWVRTNDREDYAALSNAEYSNFREVETTGMGNNTLYRSSSPIDPVLNRCEEADSEMEEAQIRTVLNMADNEEIMTGYSDYALTYYSGCNILPLNITFRFDTDEFKQKLADGFRFIASNDGPYLLHCTEGKDRTGFAVAILSCLMGANDEEIVQDYMKTYENYYGVTPDSDQYDQIAEDNIKSILADAFGVDSISDDSVDLQECAEEYLSDIGMTNQEITALKGALRRDYGGLR